MITRHIDIEELQRQLLSNVWAHQIRALSKAITLMENHPEYTQDLLKILDPAVNPAVKPRGDGRLRDDKQKPHVIGLTGFPGAGKSTLVNLLIKKWRTQNQKVAVLAIDPSSTLTGGAVLGDRIRMQEHFKDEGVFIRSMGARGALGGLSQATHGTLELLQLLGFDKILVETVGIGQSESEIMKEANTVILVLLPNTGDEVQFMKAGVIQLAHIFCINKCDLSDPYRMVHELEDNEPHKNGWKPPVVCTSALDNSGIENLIHQIDEHFKKVKE